MMLTSIKRNYILCGAAAMLALAACQTSQIVEVRPAINNNMMAADVGDSDYYSIGKENLSEQNYGLAVEAFQKSLRTNGPRVETYNGLAISYDMLSRFDLSRRYYEKALELDKSSAVTYSNLAYSQHLQGHQDTAMRLAALVKNVAQKKPDQAELEKVLEVALANSRIAETEKKFVALSSEDVTSPLTEIERIGEREWELVDNADTSKSTETDIEVLKKAYSLQDEDLPVVVLADAYMVYKEVPFEDNKDDLKIVHNAPIPTRKPMLASEARDMPFPDMKPTSFVASIASMDVDKYMVVMPLLVADMALPDGTVVSLEAPKRKRVTNKGFFERMLRQEDRTANMRVNQSKRNNSVQKEEKTLPNMPIPVRKPEVSLTSFEHPDVIKPSVKPAYKKAEIEQDKHDA